MLLFPKSTVRTRICSSPVATALFDSDVRVIVKQASRQTHSSQKSTLCKETRGRQSEDRGVVLGCDTGEKQSVDVPALPHILIPPQVTIKSLVPRLLCSKGVTLQDPGFSPADETTLHVSIRLLPPSIVLSVA
ncbi:hypothetical protein F2P81_016205 [Scophthalmus maximus]|uniref:Uncharacterized protein n=1 Tax=Scophthalmus maximus TaxID=52904 RepID=A0A6A4SID9_SCOMX|nr:hypothetical protein F2P81_016205 [Scophthalmus maximus]